MGLELTITMRLCYWLNIWNRVVVHLTKAIAQYSYIFYDPDRANGKVPNGKVQALWVQVDTSGV